MACMIQQWQTRRDNLIYALLPAVLDDARAAEVAHPPAIVLRQPELAPLLGPLLAAGPADGVVVSFARHGSVRAVLGSPDPPHAKRYYTYR